MLKYFVRGMCIYQASGHKRPPIPVFGVEGRYVSALYSAASQKNELEAVDTLFRKLAPLLLKPKVIDFIETSIVSRADKAKLLLAIAKESGMPDTAGNFLAVVADNGRLKKLKKMMSMFNTIMIAHNKKALCEVITAKPLDDKTRSSLMAALTKFVSEGKKIELTEKVDPSIMGGMIVGVEDKHIDMSISRKIQMYTELLQQPV